VSAVTEAAPPRAAAGARRLSASWHLVALTGVLTLAAFLDFFRLSRNGYANTYYAGAVRSMLRSWHNFFFVSFDPGGLVSVDKPPLSLWAEAASAKLFGYSGVSILLPEALAGVLSVWVLYLLVARYFGRVAGLVAALALAVSPVSVAINRDNNPDALFVLLLVLTVYVGARAVESGRLRTVLLAALLFGLAFNAKMLAAGIVVPGLVLGYAAFAPRSWRVRGGHLAAAGVVAIVVSFSWIAAVDLTPASARPYVGSTTNNSALSLALDYNGLGRVTGQTGGTSFGGRGGGGAFSGTPGFFRLLNSALGDQGGWLLPLAILGGISLVVAAIRLRRRRDLGALTVIGGWFVSAAVVFSYSSGIVHTYYLSALAPAACALVGAGVVSLARDARRGGAWLALPAAAIVLGGWLEVALLRRTGYLPWLQTVVIVATVAALAALAASVLVRARRGELAVAAVAIATAGLLAAPAAWSATTLKSAVNGVFPGAGPDFVTGLTRTATGGFGAQPQGAGPQGGGGGLGAPPQRAGGFGAPPQGAGGFGGSPRGARPGNGGGNGVGTQSSADVSGALAYVESHGAAKRFGLIVSSEQEAAPYVIAGKPVAAMGGFTGRETVLTHAFLSSLIRSGEARYFLLGGSSGAGPGGSSNAAASTIESICKAVPSSAWAGSSGSSGATLYDCAGKADAIASASS